MLKVWEIVRQLKEAYAKLFKGMAKSSSCWHDCRRERSREMELLVHEKNDTR